MKPKGLILPVIFLGLLGCRPGGNVIPDPGPETSAGSPSPGVQGLPSPPPLTITDISVEPGSAPNDGSTRLDINCAVKSPDNLPIRRVWLDLRHTSLNGERAFELIRNTPEQAVYAGSLKIPPLLDTGHYRIPLNAVDSEDQRGQAEIEFDVNYCRGDMPPISSAEFLRLLELSGRARFIPHNRVELLESGTQALEKRLELIRSAERQINLQTYTMSNSGAGKEIIDALMQQADTGIEVNILLNHDSQVPTSPISIFKFRFNQFLHQKILDAESKLPEVETREDSALGRLKNRPESRGTNLLLFRGENLRAHLPGPLPEEKLISHWLARLLNSRPGKENRTIDPPEERLTTSRGPGGLPVIPLLDYAAHEKILIADGERAIVGGRNIQDRYFTHWVDLDVYLEGPVVNAIQQGFLNTFQRMLTGEGRVARPENLLRAEPFEDGVPVLFVQSRPWRKEYYTLEALVRAIQGSTMHIFMSSQYLVLPDSLLRDALLEAADRGVDIRILTNSEITSSEVGFSSGYFITLNHLEPLLAAGIRIFEYNGTDNPLDPQPYFHPKEFLFDGELAAIGSFNLSLRSCYIESENLVFIHDPDFTFRRETTFLARLDNLATEITLDRLAEIKRQHPVRMEVSKFLELLY